MSKKTMKQRIAVVAVSALTAGVLTVTSAPTANAAANGAWGATNATTAASVMNIATQTDATAAGTVTFTDARSEGLISNSTASDTTATAVMRADGKIVVYLTGVTDGGSTIDLPSGATFVTGTTCDKTKTTLASGTTTRFACVDDSAALKMIAFVQPSAGTTSFDINYYQKADVTAANDGLTEAAAVTALEGGSVANLSTLTGKITVTVIPTNAFSDFTSATECTQTNSAGAETTLGYAVTSAVVPVGSTMVVLQMYTPYLQK